MSFDDPTFMERFLFKAERALMAPYFARLVRSLELRGDERALELGFGLGNVIVKLADALPRGEVVGVDPSPFMYRETEARCAGRENVRLINGDLLSADLEGPSFDLAVIHYVLHEVPREEQESTLRTLVDKLRRGGRVHIVEPTKEEHGIPVPRLRRMFTEAGMRETDCRIKKNNYSGTWEKG